MIFKTIFRTSGRHAGVSELLMSVFQEFCSYIIGDELRNDPGYWLLDAGCFS